MEGSPYIGSVSVSLLMMVVGFCNFNKLVTPKECFNYLNKDSLEPNDLTDRVPFHVWVDILFDVHMQYPISGLGLEIAKHTEFFHAGILSYLVFSRKSLFEAVSDFMLYNRLAYDFNLMTVLVNDDILELTWSDYRGRFGQLVDETAIALLFNIIKQAIFPQTISFKYVKFINDEPDDILKYQKYFKCPVFFNSPITSVAVSCTELKKIYLSKSDSILYRVLKTQTDYLIDKLEIYDKFEHRLYVGITACIQNKVINLTEVAKYMGLSNLELKKILSKKKINFNNAVNDVRKNLSIIYLKDKKIKISHIADFLCYSEQSVFQRAFKGWMGETPLQFRKRNKIL